MLFGLTRHTDDDRRDGSPAGLRRRRRRAGCGGNRAQFARHRPGRGACAADRRHVDDARPVARHRGEDRIPPVSARTLSLGGGWRASARRVRGFSPRRKRRQALALAEPWPLNPPVRGAHGPLLLPREKGSRSVCLKTERPPVSGTARAQCWCRAWARSRGGGQCGIFRRRRFLDASPDCLARPANRIVLGRDHASSSNPLRVACSWLRKIAIAVRMRRKPSLR